MRLCMTLARMVSRLAAGAWILPLILSGWLAGESSEALTTFGKTSPKETLPPSPTPPPGRECNRQSDCAGIGGTSCVRTANDPRTRCLCGDNAAPLNGRCNAGQKGLHHLCAESTECVETMICAVPNVTTTAAPATAAGHKGAFLAAQQQSALATALNEKVCVCDEEGGFSERDFYCNDGFKSRDPLFVIALSAILVLSAQLL